MMVSGCPFKKKQGFTLLEVLIAMSLMAFCLVGTVSLLTVLGNIEAENRKAVKALFCAQEALETLRFNIVADREAFESTGRDLVRTGPYEGMEKQWSIQAVGPEGELDEIIVQCGYWWKGEKKIRNLRTLVSHRP